jgi:hypothetical protein
MSKLHSQRPSPEIFTLGGRIEVPNQGKLFLPLLDLIGAAELALMKPPAT